MRSWSDSGPKLPRATQAAYGNRTNISICSEFISALSPIDANYCRFPGAAQHEAKRSGALQTRDRLKLRTNKRRACDDPGTAVHRFALRRIRETNAMLWRKRKNSRSRGAFFRSRPSYAARKASLSPRVRPSSEQSGGGGPERSRSGAVSNKRKRNAERRMLHWPRHVGQMVPSAGARTRCCPHPILPRLRGRPRRGQLACRRSTTALAAATERHRSAPVTRFLGRNEVGAGVTRSRPSQCSAPCIVLPRLRGRIKVGGRRPVIVPAGRFYPEPPGSEGDDPARGNRSRSASRSDAAGVLSTKRAAPIYAPRRACQAAPRPWCLHLIQRRFWMCRLLSTRSRMGQFAHFKEFVGASMRKRCRCGRGGRLPGSIGLKAAIHGR